MANLIALGASAMLAAALGVAAGAPARAQCRLCETPTTVAPSLAAKGRISLSVEATLDFDRLVLHGAGEGSATILPNGERRASGSVAAISGRAMVGAVVIRGEAGRAVRVELPSRIQLYTVSGGSISIDDILDNTSDALAPDLTLSVSAPTTVNLGARCGCGARRASKSRRNPFPDRGALGLLVSVR